MRTITFYSYKGGVGRSMTLANMAIRLAEFGRQVCLLDFDLEAPGLQHKFAGPLANNAKRIDKGVVDYIHRFTAEGILSDSLRDYSYSWFPFQRSCITLIPAGDPDSGGYWKRLSSIDWFNLLYESDNGIPLLLDLKEKIYKQFAPDYLLVDSRTGISELSGITLSLFADDVVVMAANNRENLEGAKKILRLISDPAKMVREKAPRTSFVLCRVPLGPSPEDRVTEQNLKDAILKDFEGLINDVTVLHSDRDVELNEQLRIAYDKNDDSAPQLAKDMLELFEKLTLGDLSEAEKREFKRIWESERLFIKAKQAIDPATALRLFDEAIALNKHKTEYYLGKAALFEKQLEWGKVIEVCDEVLRYDTMDLRPLDLKANALFRLGRIAEAHASYADLLVREPERETALLGMARVSKVENDFDSALMLLNKLLARNAQNSAAYLERADLRRKVGQFFAAFEDAFQAVSLQADNAAAYLIMAGIYAKQGNKYELYMQLDRALQSKEKLERPAEEEISADAAFQPYLGEAQFRRILEKYSIRLPDSTQL